MHPSTHPPNLGVSDFKRLRQNNHYYVDKSHFIGEVLNTPYQVLLLPRPRRFGKTLNLSMLRYFFEQAEPSQRPLFEELSIASDKQSMAAQGQFPVIFLTFKDVKVNSFQECLNKIGMLLAAEYQRLRAIVESEILEEKNLVFEAVLSKKADQSTLENGIAFLMELLGRATGKQVVVLIDEYDAPIHAGVKHSFYEEIIAFMRNLLSAALKDNADLEKGILTGILWVAKESIFSGLNNPGVFTLLKAEFSTCFGFTETETQQIMEDFGVENREIVQAWYNGFRFGNNTIYNPWSLMNFMVSRERIPGPYWINTSSNDLVRDLIIEGGIDIQKDLQTLLADKPIRLTLDDNIILRDLNKSPQTVWNFLLFSGYLKQGAPLPGKLIPQYELIIPNLEVRYFFEKTLQDWIDSSLGSQNIDYFYEALLTENFSDVEQILSESATRSLSYHDTREPETESIYHAFILGMLVRYSEHYWIRSNRESGYGRYDIMMIPKQETLPGFVIEFKRIASWEESAIERGLDDALKQIESKQYANEFREHNPTKIWAIGIVTHGKRLKLSAVSTVPYS